MLRDNLQTSSGLRAWDGVLVKYREDPEDILFNYMPAVETEAYAVTYSFSALPRYLRSSDCCASIMRTPAPMRTNEDIRAGIDSRLAGSSQTVQQRYAGAYGDTPPVRVVGEEYQARDPRLQLGGHGLYAARPERRRKGGRHDAFLLESTSNEHAGDDCRDGNQWCAGADLNRTGRVDQTDAAFLDAALGCSYANE